MVHSPEAAHAGEISAGVRAGVIKTEMLAKAIEISSNRKLGPVAATFVSQVSCPDYCPWFEAAIIR